MASLVILISTVSIYRFRVKYRKGGNKMEMFTTFFIIAIFCFTVVFWLKRSENKYRYQKTKLVDQFINRNNIHVTDLYSGMYCDLVNDEKNRSIWFFVLEQLTLKYKQIPYDDIFYVALKYDGKAIDAHTRQGQMKKEMLGGEGLRDMDLAPLVNKADLKIVKDISLTIIVDDRHASTIDALFVSHSVLVDIRNVKDNDAETWFHRLADIIDQTEDKLLSHK